MTALRWVLSGWMISAVICIDGCGYRFVGGEDFPFGINTVAVQVLRNRTSETGIETILTNDLIFEFNRSTQVRVVRAAEADAVLSGVITRSFVTNVSRRSRDSTTERRITIFIDVVLKSSSAEVLWEASGLSSSQTYEVSADEKFIIDTSQRLAIARLSRRLSERVYRLITDVE
jgi:hypothetical protein